MRVPTEKLVGPLIHQTTSHNFPKGAEWDTSVKFAVIRQSLRKGQ